MIVAIVGCGASKADRAAPARDLYTSTLFKKSLAYAETVAQRTFIASALFNRALDAGDHELIEPYERELSSMPKRRREAWGQYIADDVCAEARKHQTDHAAVFDMSVIILAGGEYERCLTRGFYAGRRVHVSAPMSGLQIGERLAWLNANTRRAA